MVYAMKSTFAAYNLSKSKPVRIDGTEGTAR